MHRTSLALPIGIRTEPARREGHDRNERRGRILDVFNRGVRRRARAAAVAWGRSGFARPSARGRCGTLPGFRRLQTATGEFQSVVLGLVTLSLGSLMMIACGSKSALNISGQSGGGQRSTGGIGAGGAASGGSFGGRADGGGASPSTGAGGSGGTSGTGGAEVGAGGMSGGSSGTGGCIQPPCVFLDCTYGYQPSTSPCGCGTCAPPSGGAGGSAGSVPVSSGGTMGTGGTTGTVIDCRTVDCSFPVCEAGYTSVTYTGSCCPVCVASDPSCASVTCAAPSCPSGFTVAREPGACCDTCAATPSAQAPNCDAVRCGMPSSCPLGYIVTNTAWTCCPTCAPDPNYCETDADCMLAWDRTSCCSCNSISTRRYAQDLCYSSANGDSRSVPASCAPPGNCLSGCPSCALLGHARSTCSNHHCS
jgi:hypothetical protein